MNEMKSNKNVLFESDMFTNHNINLVIEDKEEKQKYLLGEITNKVILGDTFKVLKCSAEKLR
ncbi:MAG: hypothetical protein QXU40_01920 [Candidatus Pacearchaeota archaeon]